MLAVIYHISYIIYAYQDAHTCAYMYIYTSLDNIDIIVDMDTYGYGLMPIKPFLVDEHPFICELFWCEQKRTRVLTHNDIPTHKFMI